MGHSSRRHSKRKGPTVLLQEIKKVKKKAHTGSIQDSFAQLKKWGNVLLKPRKIESSEGKRKGGVILDQSPGGSTCQHVIRTIKEKKNKPS